MRALKAAVIVMGVLIVAGVAVIVVTIVTRVSGGGGSSAAAAQVLLDEPAGTRIAGLSLAPERLAVQLQGGGGDRIVVVDLRTGRVAARIGMEKPVPTQ